MNNNSFGMDNFTNNLGAGLPEERGWEYKQIYVTRVPGYGFGIAVSGGRDNPHFASGDPSIAVSDVLASGPAERLLQVNDRIISVNGISLQNVDYATAVQVLRDSGDTVTLVIKRRTIQHGHSHSASFNGPSFSSSLMNSNQLPNKVTLTKNSKKEDFGIVLGCKLFIKEISSKARDQLLNTNQILEIGDFVTKLNNTNCNDLMSLKEAKKIIDSSKDKLNITVVRDFNLNSNASHQAQSSISTTGAVNNFYKGDDFLTPHHSQSYSNQNLYVQPPTRNVNLNPNNVNFDDKLLVPAADHQHHHHLSSESGPNSLPEDKSNLSPRGNINNSSSSGIGGGGGPGSRSRGPVSEANLNQLENRNSIAGVGGGIYGRTKAREEPPRPPPPRAEDYYSTRRQLYDEDPIIQKTKQPIPDARFITFHKEGSVGIRLTGGNFAGIFVTAVQPGSPASLQGLQPGDKILKVNDMDMSGVTREDAVLYLLGLQDRIELIVQFCKEEYDGVVASQKGDSFYIKTHFHYDNPAKGEMSFRSGDIFHVIDTLYNGVVGCWQVFRIGRNNQEVQKGIIPNKSRAEELATAQFNATKKEMSANESSRGSFFRRRRSSNRRSKSLGKEHWDDILFSDTVSKFPAYERVLLKHPGFTRPVILFGPIADVAREKLLKDFPDKYISPQLDASADDSTSSKPHKSSMNSNIIRLSAIRDVISTGKHALLDITPNAVERLNYAQMYPIVIFFKAETKIVIKQLRQGLPKSAHKSSKKLLEQCQKLDKVWGHVFSVIIPLNDNTDTWYKKVREIIDKQQSAALWMSESKPEESLSDDFLFPMSSLRLSYASSPESDLEHSPGPPTSSGGMSGAGGGNSNNNGSSSITPGRLTKASSDPSVVIADNNSSPNDVLPPYQPSYNTRFGFDTQDPPQHQQQLVTSSDVQDIVTNSPVDSPLHKEPSYALSNPDISSSVAMMNLYGKTSSLPQNSYDAYQKMTTSGGGLQRNNNNTAGVGGGYNNNSQTDRRLEFVDDGGFQHTRQVSSTVHADYGHGGKGLLMGGGMVGGEQQQQQNSPMMKEGLYGQVPDLPPRIDRAVKPMSLTTTPSKSLNGRSAHERLFGPKATSQVDNINSNSNDNNTDFNTKLGSLERGQNSKSDSLSSYDSFNKQTPNHRIGPNAHDDLKTTLSKIDPSGAMVQNNNSPSKYSTTTGGGGIGNGTRWTDQNMGVATSQQHGSKLDLKYGLPSGGDQLLMVDNSIANSPRNSREFKDKDSPLGSVSPRGSVERDMYRYASRSATKQSTPNKAHMETKTDYGKYSRNNNPSAQHSQQPLSSSESLLRSSHHDLRESSLSIHNHQQQQSPLRAQQQQQHHNGGFDNNGLGGGGLGTAGTGPPHTINGNNNNGGGGQTYKPVPPPKPKNYKPPYNSGGGVGGGGSSNNKQSYGPVGSSIIADSGGMVQPLPPFYQHGKSFSNPVDQHNQNILAAHHHQQQQQQMPQHGGYYSSNPYHMDPSAMPNNGGGNNNFDQHSGGGGIPPPHYQESPSRRHPSISYASRSEITPISAHHHHHHDSSPSSPYHHGSNRMDYHHHQGGGDAGGGGGGGRGPPVVVDLQSSREQRGSAFELYRKPIGHNFR